jgi:hypothetical protein
MALTCEILVAPVSGERNEEPGVAQRSNRARQKARDALPAAIAERLGDR